MSYSRGYRQRPSFQSSRYTTYGTTSGTARPNVERPLLEGLKTEPIDVLAKPTLKVGDGATINDLKYLASYNWEDNKQPTIIVPGSPREWLEPLVPLDVRPDNGTNFIDQNGYRMSYSGLTPLIKAVQTLRADKAESDFDWSSVDFVTDRNNLRKLLSWADAKPSSPPRGFRIDIQLAGDKTVLLNRWEAKTKGDRSTRRSYGFNFESLVTRPAKGCERTTGHHRIVTYDFEGLKMVVRFEVDACFPPDAPADARYTLREHAASSSSGAGSDTGDDLVNLFSKLTVGSTSSGLKIKRAGREVPQSALIEMTTRSELSAIDFDWEDAYPQLYFSQTPNHYTAKHRMGSFFSIRRRELGQGELVQIDQEAQGSFKKLRVLLGFIQRLVRKYGANGRISLVCKDDVLKVYERCSHESCLHDTLLALFLPSKGA